MYLTDIISTASKFNVIKIEDWNVILMDPLLGDDFALKIPLERIISFKHPVYPNEAYHLQITYFKENNFVDLVEVHSEKAYLAFDFLYTSGLFIHFKNISLNLSHINYITVIPALTKYRGKYASSIILNTDKYEIPVDFDGQYETLNFDVVEDMSSFYELSLKHGLLIILAEACAIKMMKEYKKYLREFKEKFPEKVLLYELNWREEDDYIPEI